MDALEPRRKVAACVLIILVSSAKRFIAYFCKQANNASNAESFPKILYIVGGILNAKMF